MSNSKRIATLWDRKNSEDAEDHEHSHGEASQAFYAGGSEHSGQQILGPNRDGPESSRLIENLFNHARQSAALVSDPNDPAQQSATGEPGSNTLPITFYHNGFTVGSDGELRDYQAPENRQFLECLRRGETPPELANRVQRGVIDVKLDNKAHIDYKPERKIQAFTGEGHRLGAPAPETETANEQQAQQDTALSSSLVVDDSKPTTTIQVRLVDNSRVVVRINLSSNVGDLVSHLRAIRPQYSTTNFVLATTFPAKELTNLEETISEAKLANASVLQKIKR